MHKKGRPVLVGTTSVERSELLADMLRQEGQPLSSRGHDSALRLGLPIVVPCPVASAYCRASAG